MGDIKIFAKMEKEQETLIQKIRIYNQDIGIKFGGGTCDMKRVIRETPKGMEVISEESVRILEKNENYISNE